MSRAASALRWITLVAVATASPARAAAPSACEPWPGEFDPLPTISDVDFIRAEWARMRGAEIAHVAERLEGEDPVEAQRLWLHARCLDPDNAELARRAERAPADLAPADLARTAPKPEAAPSVAALSPPVSPAPSAAAPSSPAPPAPSEATPVALARPAPPSVDAPPPASDPCRVGAESCPRLREVDRALARLDGLLRSAHFEEVERGQRQPRGILDGLPRSGATRTRRVRLEVLAATAHVALGRPRDAEECLSRALRADPTLRLDPVSTSPKVMRVLEDARLARPDVSAR